MKIKLKNNNGFKWYSSENIWVKGYVFDTDNKLYENDGLLSYFSTVKNSDDFAKWLLESFDYNNNTVMVAPAAGFYSTPGVGLNQIRIAYVLNEDSLRISVKILEEALKVYKD